MEDYTVVHDIDLDLLIHSVLKLREDGWKPLGGIAVTQGNRETYAMFYQAMVKDDPIEPLGWGRSQESGSPNFAGPLVHMAVPVTLSSGDKCLLCASSRVPQNLDHVRWSSRYEDITCPICRERMHRDKRRVE